MNDLPILVSTKEAAVLLKMGEPAVRQRVGTGQLAPVAQTAHGGHLFRLEDVLQQPKNRRLGDRDVHAV